MQRGRQILHNLGVSCFRDDEGHGWADFLNVLATKLYSPIFFHGLIRNVSRIAVFLETILGEHHCRKLLSVLHRQVNNIYHERKLLKFITT